MLLEQASRLAFEGGVNRWQATPSQGGDKPYFVYEGRLLTFAYQCPDETSC